MANRVRGVLNNRDILEILDAQQEALEEITRGEYVGGYIRRDVIEKGRDLLNKFFVQPRKVICPDCKCDDRGCACDDNED